MPLAWSPDGDTLLISTRIDAGTAVLQQLTLHDKKVMTVPGVSSSNEIQAAFSPDGRWIAYMAGSPGQPAAQLFVRPFPVTDVVHRIGFGSSPFWAPAGKGLYFVSAPGVDSFSFVTITTEPTFEVSEPSTIVRPVISGGGPNLPRAYDASPDNQHLIVVTAQSSAGSPAVPQIQFVLNWFDELKSRIGGG
jgi:hypothetical protein